MNHIAFLFSGQGSQYIGMGGELCESSAACRQIFECASDILGYDLLDKCLNAEESVLAQTIYAQPAIMAVSLAACKAIEQQGISAQAVGGHSLGEYAALVCSQALSMEDGFRVIKARAEAMQQCAQNQNGAMFAIMGASVEQIQEICRQTEGYVVPVNFNSPAQTVIAGEKQAAEKAAQALSSIARRCTRLKVSAAFHSKLMLPAAEIFLQSIQNIPIKYPQLPFYSNLTGDKLQPNANLKQMLADHLVSPVRFAEELGAMQRDGIDCLIELGPKKVLAGLAKKTLAHACVLHVEDAQTLQQTITNYMRRENQC